MTLRHTGSRWLCLSDLECEAAECMPRDVWDFIAGGSGTEHALGANRRALDAIAVVPRVLGGFDEADTRVTLAGTTAALPLAVAPMAYQCLVHPEGEVAAARAAAAAGVPYVISTMSSRSIEDIAGTGAALWFQLYWLRDRGLVRELLARAEHVGCAALMVTVDVPIMGRRLRDLRNAFALPSSVRAANFEPRRAEAHEQRVGSSAVAEHTGVIFDATLGWHDLEWLREQTRLPLVVKGILGPRDAVRCVTTGAQAVVVSNHGGRQLDGAVPSATALPGVVDAVAGRAEVLLDSGVRSGTDVLRALALGANGVLVGRPVLWGLAVDGEQGVGRVFDLLRIELQQALVLAGCADSAAACDLDTVVLPRSGR